MMKKREEDRALLESLGCQITEMLYTKHGIKQEIISLAAFFTEMTSTLKDLFSKIVKDECSNIVKDECHETVTHVTGESDKISNEDKADDDFHPSLDGIEDRKGKLKEINENIGDAKKEIQIRIDRLD